MIIPAFCQSLTCANICLQLLLLTIHTTTWSAAARCHTPAIIRPFPLPVYARASQTQRPILRDWEREGSAHTHTLITSCQSKTSAAQHHLHEHRWSQTVWEIQHISIDEIQWPYSQFGHLKRLNVCIMYQNITAADIYCKERCTLQAKHLTEGCLLDLKWSSNRSSVDNED